MPVYTLELRPDGQVECSDQLSTLRVRVVPRTVLHPFQAQQPISAVYMLLDDARQVYYVGETDNADVRHAQHKRKFPWWNHAVYFYLPAFGAVRLRKYLQNKLFERVRQLQSGVVLVTSLAGFTGIPPPNGDTLWNQICLCGRALRLLPFLDDGLLPGVHPVAPLQNPPPPPPLPPPPTSWPSARALAVALVEKHGGSVNYIIQILTAYKGRRAGRLWRPRLEEAGIEIDRKTGHVTDWSKARNPLP